MTTTDMWKTSVYPEGSKKCTEALGIELAQCWFAFRDRRNDLRCCTASKARKVSSIFPATDEDITKKRHTALLQAPDGVCYDGVC